MSEQDKDRFADDPVQEELFCTMCDGIVYDARTDTICRWCKGTGIEPIKNTEEPDHGYMGKDRRKLRRS
jgi:hypothetical protein